MLDSIRVNKKGTYAVFVATLFFLLTAIFFISGSNLSSRNCPRCNIILVSVDELDVNASTDSASSPMPFLSGATGDTGIVFENAIAQSSWTLPSHVAMLTSEYPAQLGVWTPQDALPPNTPTLAEVLQKGGYHTRAFSDDSFIQPQWGFGKGFEVFTSPTRLNRPPYQSLRDSVDWLQTHTDVSKPYFLFVRSTYAPSGRHTDKDSLITPDALFQALFSALEKSGATKRTMVILVADHEPGYAANDTMDTKHTRETRRTVIFFIPDVQADRVESVVELRSLPQTISGLADVEDTSLRGASFFDESAGTNNTVALSTSAKEMNAVNRLFDTTLTSTATFAQFADSVAPQPRSKEWTGTAISSARAKNWILVKDSIDSYHLYNLNEDSNEKNDLFNTWHTLPDADQAIINTILQSLAADVPEYCGGRCNIVQPYF